MTPAQLVALADVQRDIDMQSEHPNGVRKPKRVGGSGIAAAMNG